MSASSRDSLHDRHTTLPVAHMGKLPYHTVKMLPDGLHVLLLAALLWLWVNWVTPTPSIFTVIVASTVWAHTKLCSQLQNQLHKDKRRKQPKIEENFSFVALYFLQKIYSGNSATQHWFVIKLQRVIYPKCISYYTILAALHCCYSSSLWLSCITIIFKSQR